MPLEAAAAEWTSCEMDFVTASCLFQLPDGFHSIMSTFNSCVFNPIGLFFFNKTDLIFSSFFADKSLAMFGPGSCGSHFFGLFCGEMSPRFSTTTCPQCAQLAPRYGRTKGGPATDERKWSPKHSRVWSLATDRWHGLRALSWSSATYFIHREGYHDTKYYKKPLVVLVQKNQTFFL